MQLTSFVVRDSEQLFRFYENHYLTPDQINQGTETIDEQRTPNTIAAPSMVCAGVVFSIKSMLQSSCEYRTCSFVAFADLVKAYDSAMHDFFSEDLLKMGILPKCVERLEKLHRDFNVVLDFAKEKIVIKH